MTKNNTPAGFTLPRPADLEELAELLDAPASDLDDDEVACAYKLLGKLHSTAMEHRQAGQGGKPTSRAEGQAVAPAPEFRDVGNYASSKDAAADVRRLAEKINGQKKAGKKTSLTPAEKRAAAVPPGAVWAVLRPAIAAALAKLMELLASQQHAEPVA